MKISIAQRLHPFSHQPGIFCLLPGTSLRFQIFPALLRVHDLSSAEPRFVCELPVNVGGPVSNFTVVNDLEKGEIQVFGHSAKGYFCYLIKALQGSNEWIIRVRNNPDKQDLIAVEEPSSTLPPFLPETRERLSLGVHKAQEWESMQRRQDFAELFPYWLRLGQLVSYKPIANAPVEGSAVLLNKCKEILTAHSPECFLKPFYSLFLAGFQGIFCPRLVDDQFQGFGLKEVSPHSQFSPLYLLTEGANVIRSLFIKEESNHVAILPSLPPEFHAGRFLDVACGKASTISIEWSKKSLRRMVVCAIEEEQVLFVFPKEIKRFRLRKNLQEPGSKVLTSTPLLLHAGQKYFIDQFEK